MNARFQRLLRGNSPIRGTDHLLELQVVKYRRWLLLFLLVVAGTVVGLAQTGRGTILFSNKSGFVDAPVFDEDGITPLSGPQYVAQLYAGVTVFGLDPVTSPTPFRSGSDAGYWATVPSTVVTLPVPAGTKVYAQVKVWERDGGLTFEEAGANGAKVAMSRILEITLGGLGLPPTPPALLAGLNSFQFIGPSRLLPRITSNPPPSVELVETGFPASIQVALNGSDTTKIQWMHDGTAIPGATNHLLKVVAIPESTGSYQAVVRNQNGAVYSDVTLIRVSDAFLSQPSDLSLVETNSPGRLVVSVRPSPVSMAWYHDGLVIPGASGPVLELSRDISNQGNYWAVVTGVSGSATSRVARVTVPATTVARTGMAGRDLDQDGFGDLIFQHQDGSVGVWLMKGIKLKRAAFVGRPGGGASSWKAFSSGFFGDGSRPGIALKHPDGSIAFWKLSELGIAEGRLLGTSSPFEGVAVQSEGPETPLSVIAQILTSFGGSWQLQIAGSSGLEPRRALAGPHGVGLHVAGLASSRSNDKTWLVFESDEGDLSAFDSNGNGGVLTPLKPSNPGAGWRLAAVSDLDGDGDCDLVFEHQLGFLAVWMMQGQSLREAAYLEPRTAGEGWRLVGPR